MEVYPDNFTSHPESNYSQLSGRGSVPSGGRCPPGGCRRRGRAGADCGAAEAASPASPSLTHGASDGGQDRDITSLDPVHT